MKCARELENDEIALYKKMINRGAVEYMCISCLGGFFHCDEALLREKIEQFRENGCVLFAQE